MSYFTGNVSDLRSLQIHGVKKGKVKVYLGTGDEGPDGE
jgi:hypothetical protein